MDRICPAVITQLTAPDWATGEVPRSGGAVCTIWDRYGTFIYVGATHGFPSCIVVPAGQLGLATHSPP